MQKKYLDKCPQCRHSSRMSNTKQYFVSLSTATIGEATLAKVSIQWARGTTKVIGNAIVYRGRVTARFFDSYDDANQYAGTLFR